MNWYLKIVTHLVQLLTIFVLIVALYRKRAGSPYQIFFAGWLFVLLFDLLMVMRSFITKEPNLWMYNIALPLQHALVIWMFGKIIHPKVTWPSIMVFIVFAIANLFFLQGRELLNTYTISLAGMITCSLAIAKMFMIYRQDTSKSLYSDPDFWLSTGFLLYAALGTPYFTMYNFLWKEYTQFTTIYFFTFNYGFAILLNLCIIKAALCLSPAK